MEYDDLEAQYAEHLEALKEMEESEQISNQKLEYGKENENEKLTKDPAENLSKKRKVENEYSNKILSDIDMNDLVETSFEETLVNQPNKSIFEASNFFEKHKTNLKESNQNNFDCNLNRKFKHINITLLNGQKTSLKQFDSDDTNIALLQPTQHNILGKSIAILKLELNNEAVLKLKENIDELKNEPICIDPCKQNSESQLWVEKFKPKDFFELLSDDGTNRLILTWMKSWDYVVFGKELNTDKLSALSTKDLNKSANKKRKRAFNQYEADFEDKLLELDEHNRPKIKVVLISGPPGLGKTTLAHIIAKRAGYNFIEMNASDDRSAEAFKQNIESVTQIRGSVNDVNFKPNCLIIDEIDGAPQNSIQVLIDHLNENVKTKKKGSTKEGLTLLRPIICICNDLYAPSLKNLRPIALVFQCPSITTHRLAERLNTVCHLSNIKSDMDGLIALCDKTRNDIRSCLNTLQFLSKRTDKISSKLINELTIGHKDYEKSIFDIMNEIFFVTGAKKSLASNELTASKFSLIYTMCQNCDLDKLTQALFENYLNIKFRDTNFKSVQKANEWLMFGDTLNKQIREKQDFSLYNYQRYLPVLYYTLFSTSNQPKPKSLKYPHQLFENMVKLNKNADILKHFISDMSPIARVAYNSNRLAITDLLPFLNDIIQPNLRTVAIQLFTKSEKERLDSLVRTMILFNINYRQEKGIDGQYSYVLEPSIDEVVKLSGLKQRKQLGYIIKQQVAREITLEKVKAADKFKNKDNENQPTKSTANRLFPQKQPTKNAFSLSACMSVSKEKLEQIPVKPNSENKSNKFHEKGMFHSFFKKRDKDFSIPITNQTNNKTTNAEIINESTEKNKLTDGVWLKYKEGFINAVRYNIKISDLL